MSIIKNEIPILEFDAARTAVINPTHEKLDLKLPKKCVFAFPVSISTNTQVRRKHGRYLSSAAQRNFTRPT